MGNYLEVVDQGEDEHCRQESNNIARTATEHSLLEATDTISVGELEQGQHHT